MITIKDYVRVKGGFINYEVIGEKVKEGRRELNLRQVDKTTNTFWKSETVLEEVYLWRDVSHIKRHPTHEELQEITPFVASIGEIFDRRSINPEFRVRLASAVDDKKEAESLRIVFDDQDEYELKALGMHDIPDAYMKVDPDPTTKILKKDMLRIEEKQNLHSNACLSFGCVENTKGTCKRGDVVNCEKHIIPHLGDLTPENDETHLGVFRNELDQTKEE